MNFSPSQFLDDVVGIDSVSVINHLIGIGYTPAVEELEPLLNVVTELRTAGVLPTGIIETVQHLYKYSNGVLNLLSCRAALQSLAAIQVTVLMLNEHGLDTYTTETGFDFKDIDARSAISKLPDAKQSKVPVDIVCNFQGNIQVFEIKSHLSHESANYYTREKLEADFSSNFEAYRQANIPYTLLSFRTKEIVRVFDEGYLEEFTTEFPTMVRSYVMYANMVSNVIKNTLGAQETIGHEMFWDSDIVFQQIESGAKDCVSIVFQPGLDEYRRAIDTEYRRLKGDDGAYRINPDIPGRLFGGKPQNDLLTFLSNLDRDNVVVTEFLGEKKVLEPRIYSTMKGNPLYCIPQTVKHGPRKTWLFLSELSDILHGTQWHNSALHDLLEYWCNAQKESMKVLMDDYKDCRRVYAALRNQEAEGVGDKATREFDAKVRKAEYGLFMYNDIRVCASLYETVRSLEEKKEVLSGELKMPIKPWSQSRMHVDDPAILEAFIEEGEMDVLTVPLTDILQELDAACKELLAKNTYALDIYSAFSDEGKRKAIDFTSFSLCGPRTSFVVAAITCERTHCENACMDLREMWSTARMILISRHCVEIALQDFLTGEITLEDLEIQMLDSPFDNPAVNAFFYRHVFATRSINDCALAQKLKEEHEEHSNIMVALTKTVGYVSHAVRCAVLQSVCMKFSVPRLNPPGGVSKTLAKNPSYEMKRKAAERLRIARTSAMKTGKRMVLSPEDLRMKRKRDLLEKKKKSKDAFFIKRRDIDPRRFWEKRLEKLVEKDGSVGTKWYLTTHPVVPILMGGKVIGYVLMMGTRAHDRSAISYITTLRLDGCMRDSINLRQMFLNNDKETFTMGDQDRIGWVLQDTDESLWLVQKGMLQKAQTNDDERMLLPTMAHYLYQMLDTQRGLRIQGSSSKTNVLKTLCYIFNSTSISQQEFSLTGLDNAIIIRKIYDTHLDDKGLPCDVVIGQRGLDKEIKFIGNKVSNTWLVTTATHYLFLRDSNVPIDAPVGSTAVYTKPKNDNPKAASGSALSKIFKAMNIRCQGMPAQWESREETYERWKTKENSLITTANYDVCAKKAAHMKIIGENTAVPIQVQLKTDFFSKDSVLFQPPSIVLDKHGMKFCQKCQRSHSSAMAITHHYEEYFPKMQAAGFRNYDILSIAVYMTLVEGHCTYFHTAKKKGEWGSSMRVMMLCDVKDGCLAAIIEAFSTEIVKLRRDVCTISTSGEEKQSLVEMNAQHILSDKRVPVTAHTDDEKWHAEIDFLSMWSSVCEFLKGAIPEQERAITFLENLCYSWINSTLGISWSYKVGRTKIPDSPQDKRNWRDEYNRLMKKKKKLVGRNDILRWSTQMRNHKLRKPGKIVEIKHDIQDLCDDQASARIKEFTEDWADNLRVFRKFNKGNKRNCIYWPGTMKLGMLNVLSTTPTIEEVDNARKAVLNGLGGGLRCSIETSIGERKYKPGETIDIHNLRGIPLGSLDLDHWDVYFEQNTTGEFLDVNFVYNKSSDDGFFIAVGAHWHCFFVFAFISSGNRSWGSVLSAKKFALFLTRLIEYNGMHISPAGCYDQLSKILSAYTKPAGMSYSTDIESLHGLTSSLVAVKQLTPIVAEQLTMCMVDMAGKYHKIYRVKDGLVKKIKTDYGMCDKEIPPFLGGSYIPPIGHEALTISQSCASYHLTKANSGQSQASQLRHAQMFILIGEHERITCEELDDVEPRPKFYLKPGITDTNIAEQYKEKKEAIERIIPLQSKVPYLPPRSRDMMRSIEGIHIGRTTHEAISKFIAEVLH